MIGSIMITCNQTDHSTLDYALLGALGLGAAWYFFFREKKEEPAAPSYVIQPASMPSMSMSANRYRERQGFGRFSLWEG